MKRSSPYRRNRVARMLGLAILIFGALWSCSAPAKQFKIDMVLWRGVTSAERAFISAVEADGLTDNVQIFNATQDKARLKLIRRKILADPPDLLYLFGTTITLKFAGRADGTGADGAPLHVPMIFDIVADPVGSGIIRDYGPTHRNLTGVSHTVALRVQAKVIGDLGVTRVAALYNPAESNSIVTLKALKGYLADRHIELMQVPVSSDKTHETPGDWQQMANSLRGSGVQLVYLPSDSLVISKARAIVTALNQARLPTFSATENPIIKAGALMGVISHYSAAGLHAAAIAESVLRDGINAGDIPVATPSHYLFLVNQDTMNRLDYYPPIPLLRFAEFVRGTNATQH